MSIEALWSVEFISNHNIVGSGVAVLETQRILGGDAQYTYMGEYRVENSTFHARIVVSMYGNNAFSVFGDRRQFTLLLSGQPAEQIFDAVGHIEGEPQNRIVIRLTRRAELP
jgi:hypothetical protein